MKDKYIAKVAEIFDIETEDVRMSLENDFEGEEEPSFRDLVEHLDYQISVFGCFGEPNDDFESAFLDYIGA